MTFSDARIAEQVTSNFVAAWVNRGPGFHNEDYSAEEWLFAGEMEAYPTQNICTFFLTPEGMVFHYVAGYLPPETFRAELDLAAALRRTAFDGAMKLKPGGLEAIRDLHKAEAGRIKDRIAETSRRSWQEVVREFTHETYRGFRHVHGEKCVATVLRGDRYRAALHHDWSEIRVLPALDEVRLDYLYGNSFTEEPRRGAARIRGRHCPAGE